MNNNYLINSPSDIVTEIAKFLEYDDLKNFDRICNNIDYTRLFYEYKNSTTLYTIKNKDIVRENPIYNIKNNYKVLYSMILNGDIYLTQLNIQDSIKIRCSAELYDLFLDTSCDEIYRYSCFDVKIEISYYSLTNINNIFVHAPNPLDVSYIIFLYRHKNFKKICDYLHKYFNVELFDTSSIHDIFYDEKDNLSILCIEYIIENYPNSINLYDDYSLSVCHLRHPNALKLSIKILKKRIQKSESSNDIRNILRLTEKEMHDLPSYNIHKMDDMEVKEMGIIYELDDMKTKENSIIYDNIMEKIKELLDKNDYKNKILGYLDTFIGI